MELVNIYVNSRVRMWDLKKIVSAKFIWWEFVRKTCTKDNEGFHLKMENLNSSLDC